MNMKAPKRIKRFTVFNSNATDDLEILYQTNSLFLALIIKKFFKKKTIFDNKTQSEFGKTKIIN